MKGRTIAIAALIALAAASARAADRMVVSVNGEAVAGQVPAYIALDKHYFADQGLDVSFVNVNTPAGGSAAVASGDVDLAFQGLSAGFFNIAGHSDFLLLAAASDTKAGFSDLIVFASNQAYNSGLKGAADLGGRKIGISGLGASAEYALYVMSQKYKFPFDAAKIVVVNSNGNGAAAVKAGSIDAAFTTGAIARPLAAQGDGHIVASIGAEAPGIGNVIYASRKVVAGRRDALVRFFRAYLEAARDYAAIFDDPNSPARNSPAAAAMVGMVARHLNLPESAVRPSLPYILTDGAIDVADVNNQLALWKKLDMADPSVDPAKIIDLSILNQAKAGQ